MRFLTATFVLLLALPCAAQDVVDSFIGRVYTNAAKQRMPYRLFVPPAYDKDKQYPLVLWLHGAGGAGTNNRAQISGDQIPGTHTWTKPQNQARNPTFVLGFAASSTCACPESDPRISVPDCSFQRRPHRA